jgi:eukaryotic-like serine/threonine-protein kinase
MEKSTLMPSSASPDGKLVAGFYGSNEVLWALRLPEGSSGDAKPESLVDSQPGKRDPHFSPDGRWVAYRSNETGANEVYVAPYPGPGAKIPISTGGGATPRWSQDGRELFYRTQNPNQVLAVDVQTSPSFRAGTPKVLFEEKGSYTGFYDVSPDGKRFLMIKRPGAAQGLNNQVTVVLNWFEELRRRAPPGK